jgi:hypothetical protein
MPTSNAVILKALLQNSQPVKSKWKRNKTEEYGQAKVTILMVQFWQE